MAPNTITADITMALVAASAKMTAASIDAPAEITTAPVVAPDEITTAPVRVPADIASPTFARADIRTVPAALPGDNTTAEIAIPADITTAPVVTADVTRAPVVIPADLSTGAAKGAVDSTTAPFSEPIYSTTAPFSAPVDSTTAPFSAPVDSTTAPFSAPVDSTTAPFSAPVDKTTAPIVLPVEITMAPNTITADITTALASATMTAASIDALAQVTTAPIALPSDFTSTVFARLIHITTTFFSAPSETTTTFSAPSETTAAPFSVPSETTTIDIPTETEPMPSSVIDVSTQTESRLSTEFLKPSEHITFDIATARTFFNFRTVKIGGTTEALDISTPDRWNNTDISQLTSEISKCDGSSIFLPNFDNCNTFFQCSDEVLVLSYCPENYHFNRLERMCQEPCIAKCDVNADCQISTVPEHLSPVSYICERNDFLARLKCNEYTDCSESLSVTRTCPEGLHFNPTTRVCDWPRSAGCGKMLYPLYPPYDLVDCPCKSCLVPSNHSCSDYYLCLGDIAYHLSCSNNLRFDRSLNTCNYADVVECAIITTIAYSIKSETSSFSTTFPTTEATKTTMKLFPTAEPRRFTCPSKDGFFKNTTDCGKFIQCSNWYPYEMTCPPTTHFSKFTHRCVNPCDAKCDMSLACESSTARPMDPQCPCSNCTLPSSKTCTDYVRCTNGKARVMKCRKGQTFDKGRGVCDWADRVQCEHSEMCPERDGYFADKMDCHKYIYCLNGIPYVQKCDYKFEFDPDNKRCDWPKGRCNNSAIDKEFDFETEEKRNGFQCPKSFGYFSHKSHCGQFYQCSYGTPILKECSDGLLYNPRYQTCDWKRHVHCNTNRDYQPKRCRMYYGSLTCQSDRKPLPHVQCNMYYDCMTGRACLKQCPIGLYFNRTTDICDLPQLVECYNPEKLDDDTLRGFSKKCSESGEGHVANPFDETCYYRCRQGKVIPGCCSRGRVYNERKNKCERRKTS